MVLFQSLILPTLIQNLSGMRSLVKEFSGEIGNAAAAGTVGSCYESGFGELEFGCRRGTSSPNNKNGYTPEQVNETL